MKFLQQFYSVKIFIIIPNRKGVNVWGFSESKDCTCLFLMSRPSNISTFMFFAMASWGDRYQLTNQSLFLFSYQLEKRRLIFSKTFHIQKVRHYYFVKRMIHKKSEDSSHWKTSTQSPVYLDTAYRQLVRQQHKAASLKNRTKVLYLNQDHILKQVQNNQLKLQKLNQIKQGQSQQHQMLSKDKQKKSQLTLEQKRQNSLKRQNHDRQMSCIIAEQMEERDKIRNQAKKMRKENQCLIEANRSLQHAKKRQVRNRIHDDIMESRSTIKNFFASKHEKIVLDTQQQVKKLNHKRIKEELMTLSCSGRIVEELQGQVKEMKTTLKQSRLGIDLKRQESGLALKKKAPQETHPLVKKIETVMNIYTKFL